MIYSYIKVQNKPQTLGWFDTQNDYKISMKLESISFNIGNQNNVDVDFDHSRSFQNDLGYFRIILNI